MDDKPLLEQVKHGVKALFRQADSSGDGLISREEFDFIFRRTCHWSAHDCSLVFDQFDANGDGMLSYEEFFDWIFTKTQSYPAGSAASSAKLKLGELFNESPYMVFPHHALHVQWQAAVRAVESSHHGAMDRLHRLEREVYSEDQKLAAAFRRFDFNGSGELGPENVKLMMRYLNFPDSDEDIASIFDTVDFSKSGTLSFSEFQNYVGLTGGSTKMFAERRRRISEEAGFLFTNEAANACDSGSTESDAAALALQETGVDEDAQAYWRLVLSPSEFTEVENLTDCQRHAVSLIRRLARKNHDDALPILQARATSLGFQEQELWNTLAWIRELAPIVIHINLDNILRFMETDTYYRNQFETGTGGGTIDIDQRTQWESALFGTCYDSALASARCKYGVLNVMNDHRGVTNCYRYGDSYVVLKDVRLRCTFAPCDSSCCDADKLAVLDYYAHVLTEYSDPELEETMKVANARDKTVVGNSCLLDFCNYKEVQIHGDLSFRSHIERLVVNERHKDDEDVARRVQDVATKWGWSFSWMDEEQKRIEEQVRNKIGWKDRMARTKTHGDLRVEQGFCKQGCGRRVAPGKTRSGASYDTCCRGCILGFGHDRACGKHDTSDAVVACSAGCGRPVAFGRNPKGRPFATCCKGCAQGDEHDGTCQQRPTIEEGRCKLGCGRKSAVVNGKRYDTCCQKCAKGLGHNYSCVAEDLAGQTHTKSQRAEKSA